MDNKQKVLLSVLSILLSSDGEEEACSSSKQHFKESSDEDLNFTLCKIPRLTRSYVENYLEDVVPLYTNREFKKHFRISRELFEDVVKQFEDSSYFKSLTPGHKFSAECHLATFMWFATHECSSFRDIAFRFNLSLWTVCHIIQRVTYFLSGLSESVIKWPDQSKQNEINAAFALKGFKCAIGAIDGTHIVIGPPQRGKDDYINRKGRYSIVLQAIVDHEGRFIDIFVGFPGSVHDSRVLCNSTIYPLLGELCRGSYILADSAYPCTENILTPYRDNGHLTIDQKTFNKKLSSARVIVEHAFGVLKQRFRQLYHCKLKGMEKLCHFVRACCVLHNMINSTLLEDEENYDQYNEEATNSSINLEQPNQDSTMGKEMRDRICRELSEN